MLANGWTEDERRPAPPSRAMGQLLRAGMARGEAAEKAWASWLDSVDGQELEAGATALLSLVARNLTHEPTGLAIDDSIEGRVRGVQRQTWARNRVLWSAGAPLLDRLAATVAVPLLLPPTALLPAYDGDWGARPLQRIDVALPIAAVDETRDALAATGWAVDHLSPSLLRRTRAGFEARWSSEDASGNAVTIRWRILRGIGSTVVDEQMLGAAATTEIESSKVHVLHPADALLERLWNSRGERSAAWIADVVQLSRGLVTGDDPDPDERFAARCRSFGVEACARQRLELVATTVPDPAVSAALVRLRRTRPGAVSMMRTLPEPATRLGRAWAGHAAGQGLGDGARSLLSTHWTARRLRHRASARGSDQRR